MKKAIPFFIIFGCIVAGIIWLFHGCGGGPSHDQEAQGLDSLHTHYQSDSVAKTAEIIRLKASNDRWASRFDSLSDLYTAGQKVKAAGIIAVQRTLETGDDAAWRHDTAAILVNWDSLRAEVKAGLPIIKGQDSLSQAMIEACMREGSIKDSIAQNYASLWRSADTAYNRQRSAYNGLLKDYNSVNGQIKFFKPVAIGAAALVVLEIARVIIHK